MKTVVSLPGLSASSAKAEDKTLPPDKLLETLTTLSNLKFKKYNGIKNWNLNPIANPIEIEGGFLVSREMI